MKGLTEKQCKVIEKTLKSGGVKSLTVEMFKGSGIEVSFQDFQLASRLYDLSVKNLVLSIKEHPSITKEKTNERTRRKKTSRSK